MAAENQGRPPYPPFTAETAQIKVKAAQDAWNTKDPDKVKLAYTPDSIWRNRDVFLEGRNAIASFLRSKWARERGYRLRKELFSFSGDKIAVQFWYEWYSSSSSADDKGGQEEKGQKGEGQTGQEKGDGEEKRQWYRTYGLEDWTFASDGLMRKRQMSANDVPITEAERWFVDGVDVNSVHIGEEHW